MVALVDTDKDFQAEREASGEGEIKDLGEGGAMNWQGARTDGKGKMEPVSLTSERRRPTLLGSGVLCPGQR